ncbi:MAG: hypothetical protein A2201_12605 [Alicyclobacillus sp. RIFOXYA1_FULL_53_8]|nr:MAG: hypothetical protein A2201_12605 [Alicyclobacillus sp. RIFOXYA1_FULL_53_8]
MRPIAERTILKDLDVSSELRSRIFTSVQAHVDEKHAQFFGSTRHRTTTTLISVSVALMGALTLLGFALLHSQHTRTKAESTISSVAIASIPVVAAAYVHQAFKRDERRITPASISLQPTW